MLTDLPQAAANLMFGVIVVLALALRLLHWFTGLFAGGPAGGDRDDSD